MKKILRLTLVIVLPFGIDSKMQSNHTLKPDAPTVRPLALRYAPVRQLNLKWLVASEIGGWVWRGNELCVNEP